MHILTAVKQQRNLLTRNICRSDRESMPVTAGDCESRKLFNGLRVKVQSAVGGGQGHANSVLPDKCGYNGKSSVSSHPAGVL